MNAPVPSQPHGADQADPQRTAQPSAPTPPLPTPGGERRQLTVLFCDLVGSSDLGARVDPEVFHEIVDSYYQVCGEAIARFDGHITNYLGDGIVALFGYPLAHEDSADGAVRAGLALQAALAAGAGAERMHGERVAARVGIHTGLVVINVAGSAERREVHALGDAVNVAARVQGAASSGAVVVTESTRRLLRANYTFTDKGQASLKGIAVPVSLSHVEGELDHRVDDARDEDSLTRHPFVGRGAERAQIATTWQRAMLGHGGAILLRGEAGIGKSRLIAQARHDLATSGEQWITVQSSRLLRGSAFALVADVIRRALHLAHDCDKALASQAVHESLTSMGTLGAGAEYYLRGLLGLRDETDVAPILSKDHQRRRMIEVCSTWINAQARVQPTAIIVEDLHWADPSSIEVLDACVQNIATSRLLLLVTTRPEFGPPWVHAEHHTTLSLTRLDAVEIRELIQHRLSGMDRARDLIDALASRSDGIPLFAEELAIAYADTMHDSAAAIPATLHDSLMARLDRLSRAKPLAQFAAVLGREFSANELRSIVSSTAEEFDAALLELVAADLITIEQLATDMRCEFKHGLVQQAAYDSLLHRNRAEIHAVIAERMLTHHDLADHPQLVVVAHHLSESHQLELAIDAWEHAANRATATSANQEAVSFYDTALELLSQLPDTADRTQREITMLLNKVSFHFMIEGPTGSHALTALARMRALSKTLPHDDYQHIDVLANSIGFMLSKGDLDNASDLADEFFVAAVESGNDGLICQAHISLASIALNRGALNAAVDHARVALAHEGPYDHPIGLQTSRSFALLYGGSAACILGDFDFGLPCADELFAIATEPGGDPLKALLAKVGATVLAVNLRRFEQTKLLAHELDDAGRLFGLDTLIGWGCIYGGWAAAHCAVAGSAEAIAGAAQARLGLGMHIETHQNAGIAQSFALVAEAHLRAGLFEEGIALIEDALSRADHQQSHQYSVELLMNRALLRAAISGFDDETIEQDFVTALSIANEINAGLFELRTRTNYARWLHTKQRSVDAVSQLASTLAAIGPYELHDIHAAREFLDERGQHDLPNPAARELLHKYDRH